MTTDTERAGTGTGVEYEFTDEQNAAISTLITVMRIAGVAWIVFGVVCAVTLVLVGGQPATISGQQAAAVIGLVVNVAMALATFRAAASFRQVVETKGHDIAHTMAAVTRLRRVFSALRIVIVVGLGLGVIVFFYKLPSVGNLPIPHV